MLQQSMEQPQAVDAQRMVMEKTLALYCSFLIEGCWAKESQQSTPPSSLVTLDDPRVNPRNSTSSINSEDGGDDENDSDHGEEGIDFSADAMLVSSLPPTDDLNIRDERLQVRPQRSKRGVGCSGRLVMLKSESSGSLYIWYVLPSDTMNTFH